jgi:transcriptional regulator
MYTPEPFNIDDQRTIGAFIRANPLATVAAHIDGKTEATHIPIDRLSDGSYYGHLARNNPLSRVDKNQELLVIFTGPHAYISPTMYASEFNVPTWNYSAVHCYGHIAFIDDAARTWELFQELVERYEGRDGWKLPNEERFRNLLGHIRFFEFHVERIEAKFKFSQNKPDADVARVISGLRAEGNREAADFMEQIHGSTDG